jgi:hypothetical protein
MLWSTIWHRRRLELLLGWKRSLLARVPVPQWHGPCRSMGHWHGRLTSRRRGGVGQVWVMKHRGWTSEWVSPSANKTTRARRSEGVGVREREGSFSRKHSDKLCSVSIVRPPVAVGDDNREGERAGILYYQITEGLLTRIRQCFLSSLTKEARGIMGKHFKPPKMWTNTTNPETSNPNYRRAGWTYLGAVQCIFTSSPSNPRYIRNKVDDKQKNMFVIENL